MYQAFYRLQDNPFRSTPDPAYLYLSEHHREALSGLVHGICARTGLTVLLGEAGTGKTTLLSTLLTLLNTRGFVSAIFTNSVLTREEFYDALLLKLQVDCSSTLKSRQLMALEKMLLQSHSEGRRVIVIVDEAQQLSGGLLEEIRSLLNIETRQSKLLNIIIAGQPEFGDALSNPEMRHFKQRISCICRLRPLVFDELHDYIQHRLVQAGNEQADLFAEEALPLIYKYTEGIPRLVNTLCEAALHTGFVLAAPQITPVIIKEVMGDLDIELKDRPSRLWQANEEQSAGTRSNGSTPTPTSSARECNGLGF